MRRLACPALTYICVLPSILGAAPQPADFRDGVIHKGEITVTQFLEFLSRTEGVPVLFDSSQASAFDRTIRLVGPTPATYAVAKAILEIHGFRVAEHRLADGSRIIEITAGGPGRFGLPPIIELGPEGETVTRFPRPDERVILVIRTRYADAAEVQTLLKELLGEAGARAIIISDATPAAPPDGRAVVAAGEGARLAYVEQLLAPCLDPADRRIVELFRFPAGVDVASVARDLKTAVAAPAAAPPPGSSPPPTVLLADGRTQRLVVAAATAEELQRIHDRIDSIRAGGPRGPRTRLYRVRHGSASALARTLRTRLPSAAVELTPLEKTRALLVRSPAPELEKAFSLLERLDRPAEKPPAAAAPAAE